MDNPFTLSKNHLEMYDKLGQGSQEIVDRVLGRLSWGKELDGRIGGLVIEYMRGIICWREIEVKVASNWAKQVIQTEIERGAK